MQNIGLPNKVRQAIFDRDDRTCQYCNKHESEGINLSIDHIHPQFLGGGHESTNLITACKWCNTGKRDRPLKKPPTVREIDLTNLRSSEISLRIPYHMYWDLKKESLKKYTSVHEVVYRMLDKQMYEYISFTITPRLAKKLKLKLSDKGNTLQEVIEKGIRKYMREK